MFKFEPRFVIGWCLRFLPALICLGAHNVIADVVRKPPAIKLQECVPISVPPGPEDLARVPGRKTIIVSTARRNLLTRNPRGRLVRVDLDRCRAKELKPGCTGEPKPIFPPAGVSSKLFSPVGLGLLAGDNGSDLVLVDSGGKGRVLSLLLDDQGRVVGEPRILGECREAKDRDCRFLTSKINGIGISNRGDVLVTNARKRPDLAFRYADEMAWFGVTKPGFGFANGVAFIPRKKTNGDDQHVLIADFTRRSIRLLRLSGDNVESRCKMPALALPDNLHWVEGEEGKRLLVGTFGRSLSRSLAYFLHIARDVPAQVWEVDMSSLLGRLDREEALPADCGIGAAHWRLLLTDPKSDLLAGASAAVKVDDLLVIGQLRRPLLLVCPWRAPAK